MRYQFFIELGCDFDDFFVKERDQVGRKIEAELNIILKRLKEQKPRKKHREINDFGCAMVCVLQRNGSKIDPKTKSKPDLYM